MDLLERYYDKRTFTLYALLVETPDKNVWLHKIFRIFSTLILSFTTVFQLVKLVNEGFRLELIIELLPTITATGGTLFYLLFIAYASSKQYETLMSIMTCDLEAKRTQEEDAIKRQYAKNAKLCVDVFTTIFFITMCGIPLTGFLPFLLDFLMPLTNQTRGKELLMNGDIFLDEEKYFYYIYAVESLAIPVICIVVGVSENMSIIIAHHLSGMFAVVGHQLENLTEKQQKDLVSYEYNEERKVQVCIERHQRTLRFAGLAADFYDTPLTIVLIATFCALTVSLVQVTDPQLISMKMVIYTIVQVCQFFIVSRMGQFVIDESGRISENAYQSKWNICQPATRKLLQMVILRSSRPCEVVARKMYTLSIENFMSVIHTATSFFVVLRQSHEMPTIDST